MVVEEVVVEVMEVVVDVMEVVVEVVVVWCYLCGAIHQYCHNDSLFMKALGVTGKGGHWASHEANEM